MTPKIVSLHRLKSRIELQKRYGFQIALCHGCFDVLTIGHIKHFKAARNLCLAYGNVGVWLVVTVTQDKFVNKGPDRPIFTEHQRAEMISSLDMVDLVAINQWENAVETIKLLKPDFYVKGGENRGSTHPGFLAECRAIEQIGGKVVYTDEPTYHTTEILRKLKTSETDIAVYKG